MVARSIIRWGTSISSTSAFTIGMMQFINCLIEISL